MFCLLCYVVKTPYVKSIKCTQATTRRLRHSTQTMLLYIGQHPASKLTHHTELSLETNQNEGPGEWNIKIIKQDPIMIVLFLAGV